MILYSAVLFFVLTPGIFLTLPQNESKYVVAGVHALIFAILYSITHKYVWNIVYGKTPSRIM